MRVNQIKIRLNQGFLHERIGNMRSMEVAGILCVTAIHMRGKPVGGLFVLGWRLCRIGGGRGQRSFVWLGGGCDRGRSIPAVGVLH